MNTSSRHVFFLATTCIICKGAIEPGRASTLGAPRHKNQHALIHREGRRGTNTGSRPRIAASNKHGNEPFCFQNSTSKRSVVEKRSEARGRGGERGAGAGGRGEGTVMSGRRFRRLTLIQTRMKCEIMQIIRWCSFLPFFSCAHPNHKSKVGLPVAVGSAFARSL